MRSDSPPSPVLAAPGAGLPAPELFVARLLFRVRRRWTPRAATRAVIAQERERIVALVDSRTPEEAARRVLIPRLRGLEDSSRWWSMLMTLDHLRIVNVAVAHTIAELAAGRMPAGQASTAAVKPSPTVGRDVIAAFAASCDRLQHTAAAVPDLATRLRYAHPWFGPLDAGAWYFLAGFHLALHRRQLEHIQRGLARPAPLPASP
jgi:hypothetical protein